jgi:hypothetical protein
MRVAGRYAKIAFRPVHLIDFTGENQEDRHPLVSVSL